MADFAFCSILASVIAVLWAREFWLFRNRTTNGYTQDMSSREGSLKILGPLEYQAMKERISDVMRSHQTHEFVTMSVKASEIGHDASEVLHHLLPGERVELSGLWEDSPEVTVYAKGRSVGKLSRYSGRAVREIMEKAILKGMYVWRQNCYGECNDTDLDVVLFYTKRNSVPTVTPFKN